MVNVKSNSSWSPVQSVLKVSNLPADITALQIRHLLSFVRDNWTSDGLRKVDSGVTVIQIYSSRSHDMDTIQRRGPISPPLSVSPSSDDPPPYIASALSRRLSHPTMPALEYPLAVDSPQPSVSDLAPFDPSIPIDNESLESNQTCNAYIHFMTNGYLFQAEMILRSMTVNGKRVKVRYEWWNPAPLLRVWAKLRSGAK